MGNFNLQINPYLCTYYPQRQYIVPFGNTMPSSIYNNTQNKKVLVKKEDDDTLTKWAIGIGIAALGIIAYCVTKGKSKQVNNQIQKAGKNLVSDTSNATSNIGTSASIPAPIPSPTPIVPTANKSEKLAERLKLRLVVDESKVQFNLKENRIVHQVPSRGDVIPETEYIASVDNKLYTGKVQMSDGTIRRYKNGELQSIYDNGCMHRTESATGCVGHRRFQKRWGDSIAHFNGQKYRGQKTSNGFSRPGSEMEITYDDGRRIERYTCPRGNKVTWELDRNGYLTKEFQIYEPSFGHKEETIITYKPNSNKILKAEKHVYKAGKKESSISYDFSDKTNVTISQYDNNSSTLRIPRTEIYNPVTMKQYRADYSYLMRQLDNLLSYLPSHCN